jgi:hypothetical protein
MIYLRIRDRPNTGRAPSTINSPGVSEPILNASFKGGEEEGWDPQSDPSSISFWIALDDGASMMWSDSRFEWFPPASSAMTRLGCRRC